MQKLIQIAKNQPDNQVFESRAHKECLQYIIKIMRTFLVSSFIANSEGSEMQIELRK